MYASHAYASQFTCFVSMPIHLCPHIDVVASTCLYAVGLLQTYTLKIAENNNKAALTKISVVVPPIDIYIVFTSVQ